MANISKLKVNGTTYDITAIKATQDSAGQQINTTYIKGLSASNATLTYTKGNGTTGTVTVNNVANAGTANKLSSESGSNYLVINTTKDSWDVLGSNPGKWLKSIRTKHDAPPYSFGDFSAAIAFGGGDTKGIITHAYNGPLVKFAGGSGSTASWKFAIYGGYNNEIYDLNNFPTKTGGGASGTWGINISGNANNATKWNGLINDLTTENNTDTWIPVLKDNKLQHTTKANMTVGKANTAGTADTAKACSGNSATATKATQDSAGQQINTTYIKALSISEKTITYTKGNGTTGTLDVSGAVPAGFIGEWGGNTIPAGWLLCDGSAVSRTTYAKLFSAIGTTWGAGNGSTTFNLPNSIGRFAEGASTSGSYKSAGLPNIAGKISFYGNRGGVQKQEGAFLPDNTVANQVPALNESYSLKSVDQTITFYASRSSSIYGNSTTVQPNSYTVKKIIKY